jgi:hypothetical protein
MPHLSGGVATAGKDETDGVDPVAYAMTRARAREYALTRMEHTSGPAKRPYDLRHAGIAFRLHSGVDPAECARRAGRSLEVLFRHYATFLDGVREHVNRDANERRLTAQRPGQVPLFVLLEEAELLRRVRDEEVLGLLVVLQHHLVGLAAHADCL